MAAGTTRRRRPLGGVSGSLLALIALLCCAALAPTIAAAAEPGAIAGTATHASVPVEGIEVCVAGPEEPPCTQTGITGTYSFGSLEAGTYRVVFSGTGYVTQTLEGIVVAESETATANAELEATGIFDGTVFDSNNLAPIAGAEACATQEGGGPGQGCATTDGSGEFEEELPPGHYEVSFTHPGYATISYYGVEITEGGGFGTDVLLEENGVIEGTVTGSGGSPVPSSLVCVNATNGAYFNSCAFTNAEGEYAFGEIPPYEYEVEVTGQVCDSGSGCEVEECVLQETCTRPYVPLVYEEAVAINNGEATIVPVAPGETVEGIDVELLAGGKIEGTVTLAGLANAPLAGIEVSAGPESINARAESATTNAAGEYTIEGLAEGAFLVRFSEACGEEPCAGTYVTQWYAGKAEEAEATPVAVSAATPQTGIDAAMVETSPTAPAFTSNPVLGGGTTVGSTLSCSTGTWSNNPTSIAYAWQRGGVAIAGQAGATYVVTSADQGTSLTCTVTVANAPGSVSATSNALAIPTAAAVTPITTPAPPEESTPTPKPSPATATGKATAKAGTVTLTLKCGGQVACKGSLKLVYEAKSKGENGKTTVKKITIGSASFQVPAGKSKAIKVKLTKQGKSLLAEAGKGGLKVKLTGSGVKSRTLTLKAS